MMDTRTPFRTMLLEKDRKRGYKGENNINFNKPGGAWE